MNPVMTPRQGRKGEARSVAADAPPGLNTTLDNVMATLQTVVEPGQDDLDRTGDRAGSPQGRASSSTAAPLLIALVRIE